MDQQENTLSFELNADSDTPKTKALKRIVAENAGWKFDESGRTFFYSIKDEYLVQEYDDGATILWVVEKLEFEERKGKLLVTLAVAKA